MRMKKNHVFLQHVNSSFTSNTNSPVDSSYLLKNLSLLEIFPLARLHDTSGFGSPLTTALKTADFPIEHMESIADLL